MIVYLLGPTFGLQTKQNILSSSRIADEKKYYFIQFEKNKELTNESKIAL